jgi:hypothetical protein
MSLSFIAIITSVDCSYDNNACTVDGNSICDAHTGKCVCNIGYAVFFKTKCEGKFPTIFY